MTTTMDFQVDDIELLQTSTISVVLGKNGCGKSKLLTVLDEKLAFDDLGLKRYISPERMGTLQHNPSVENNIQVNAAWMTNSRRANQAQQFREQSVSQYRRLELASYRQAEDKREVSSFLEVLAKLNSLLDNVELRRHDQSFRAHSKHTGDPVEPNHLSSGESELVALGIELLTFAYDLEPGKVNVLLLDEPDVHLHPDLQARLITFMCDLADEHGFRVILATHSTAILGALADYQGASVAFMRAGDQVLTFETITEAHRRVLPVFGAHPLSKVFNQEPVLVVEGDDDVRIWQQAVRTSSGRVKVHPVSCDGVASIAEYESVVGRLVSCVYDNARAISLRDGDGTVEQLEDNPPVMRIRLACHSAENLLLTDEVLTSVGTNWTTVVERMDQWINANSEHSRHTDMVAFREAGYDRKNHDLKEIRMLIVGVVLGSSKPWEVLVGQALGSYVHAPGEPSVAGSLGEFLSAKGVANLCRRA